MTDIETEGLKLLQSIKYISKMIMKLQEDIDTTYTRITSTTVKPKIVDVQTSTPRDPMGDAVAAIVEYEDQLQKYQTELIEAKKKTISILKTLDLDDQLLLISRYISGTSKEKMADEFHYSYFGLYKRLNRAEERFCEKYAELEEKS